MHGGGRRRGAELRGRSDLTHPGTCVMVLRSSGRVPKSQGCPMAEPSTPAPVAQRQVAERTVALRHSPVPLVVSVDRHTSHATDRTVMAYKRAYPAWNRTGLTALMLGIGAHEPNVRPPQCPHLFAVSEFLRLGSITAVVFAWSGLQSDHASDRPRSEQARVWTIP